MILQIQYLDLSQATSHFPRPVVFCIFSLSGVIWHFLLQLPIFISSRSPRRVATDAMTTVAAAIHSTNAHASQMNPPAASPVKSPRRVLGELAQNVQLTPKHAHSYAKSSFTTAPGQSPLKAQDALHSAVKLAEKENDNIMSGSASRKRPYSSMESSCRRDAMGSPAKRQQEMRVETVSPALLRFAMPPVRSILDFKTLC
jgi:hypothetical protein